MSEGRVERKRERLGETTAPGIIDRSAGAHKKDDTKQNHLFPDVPGSRWGHVVGGGVTPPTIKRAAPTHARIKFHTHPPPRFLKLRSK